MPGAKPMFLVLFITLSSMSLAGLHASLAAAADAETENWKRLRAMPREERQTLWEKLKEFDSLSAADKAAIRSLDAQITRLPADEQASYLAVLRRYYHWVQGLSEEQRNELNSVPLTERMKLVSKLRAQERTNTREVPLFLQLFDFSAPTPFETAHRIKAWLELTPEQRLEIEALEGTSEQLKRLADLTPHVKLPLRKGISKNEEEALLPKMEAHPQLKAWLNSALSKKTDPAKQEKARRRIASNYFFLEKPPAPVEPRHLLRFAAALPPWNRGQFDHLPPEEARRRLTVLYRLVFPAPGEMPERPAAKVPDSPALPAPLRPGVPPPPKPGHNTGTNPF